MSEVTQLKPEFDAEEYACIVREIFRCTWFIENLMIGFIEECSHTEQNHVAALAECGKTAAQKQMDMLERLRDVVGVPADFGNVTMLGLLERPNDERIADLLPRAES
ncbi:MAG: hypothetical protein E2O54_03920 [Gammaproteobacteria bacterium]|nr:MAG: hypothetical protein E2O54_03920 [Gammaproteobacteria bacterium]